MSTAAPSAAHPAVPARRRSGAATLMPFIRQSLAGLRLLIGLMVVLGLVYPLAVTGISQLTMRWQADGSLLTADGGRTDSAAASAGSALIGQDFTGAQWFHSRPSAGGWNTLASGGSNLGPTNPSLAGTVAQRRAAIAAEEGVSPADVPADAVTASASGLDPDISPDYARLQVARVARENGLPAAQVSALVAGAITGRDLGFLGEPRVNVLQLNLALRNLEKMGQ